MHAEHRSRAVLAAAGALAAAALAGAPAQGQDAARDAIERCRGMATEAERFACMEGLVLGVSNQAQPPEPTAPAAPAAPTAPIDAAPAPAPAPAAQDDGGRRGLLSRLPFTGRRAAPSVTSDAAAAESLGAEQVQARSGEGAERPRMSAHVVSYEEIFRQRLRVELDNGQVWQQVDGIPPWREEQFGAPDEVEIFPSRFGGYRMRLVGKNLTLGVERVH